VPAIHGSFTSYASANEVPERDGNGLQAATTYRYARLTPLHVPTFDRDGIEGFSWRGLTKGEWYAYTDLSERED
jgi:hypothetical protein